MSQLTAAIFCDGYVIEHVALDAGIPPHGSSEFVWIEVLDPVDSDFAMLEKRLGLPSLAVEDSMRPERIPKVDLYDDQIFVDLCRPLCSIQRTALVVNRAVMVAPET